MYLDEQGNVIKGLSTNGYLAVGVPGTVKGLDYALTEYGTRSREKVILPSVKIAEEGFRLQQGDVDIFEAGKNKLSQPNVAEIFLKNDEVYQPGDILAQPDLANTLKAIAEKGTEAFYQGEIAQKVVAASNENNGILSLEDFANYNVRESEPIRCSYRGYQVISSPPPGGGTTVCQMLNILSGYNLKESGWRTSPSLHYILSSMLLAFGDRNQYLADPSFVDNPTQKLLSDDYANQLRDKIKTDAIDPKSVYLNTQQEGTNTTHYSVVDQEGNAVAVTYTINSSFGSGVMAPDTGFILNNEMDDFTTKVGASNQFGLRQGEANLIQPGKRPLSSMSPTIVTKDGQLVLVTGSPGGSTIPTTVLQVITNVVDYDMNIEEAIHKPRIHYQGFPNKVLTEPYAIESKTLVKLWEKGYKVTPLGFWGAAESIYIDPQTNLKFSTNDSRKSSGKAIVP
ncbi:MAG: gamma-glutamyltransferase [Xenococcaceae cyanobacterium MO_207.B15]|nr:gamma-glutamyltransferase [Xenococcaceae cyanobacterium MO_207.B15]